MDQTLAKKELQELIKREDLKNKTCIDCGNPNPQWASLSFAVFLCLQCAGTHRGFGVHISFVRSVSMDTWHEEQLRRMKLGGNLPFRDFMQAYSPAEQGGYKDELSSYDTYHCWAAAQYKEKLTADLEGKSWSPSPPPADFAAPKSGTDSPNRPSSAQGLRKSRTSGRNMTGSSFRQMSASPANSPNPNSSFSTSGSGTFSPDLQKSANESFFARLGATNAERSADLPPSQGGRYQGFGNSPSPSSTSEHPSFGLSSASAPTLSDFQENPSAALSKGWSLFSSVVVGATRVVQESVIQPGLEKVRDPDFQASVRGYVDEAGKRVGAAGSTANQWSKQQLGVDVAESVGGIVDTVKSKVVGEGHVGYGALSDTHDGDDWGHYHDAEDDFFGEFNEKQTPASSSSTNMHGTQGGASSKSSAPTSGKKTDDWDEWQNF